MDAAAVLAAYDADRRDPIADAGYQLDRVGSILRMIGHHHSFIQYSRLDPVDAPRAVAEQAADFRARGQELEWKVYDHDLPRELPQLLAAEGFVADPRETLMVLDLSGPLPPLADRPELEIRSIHDDEGVRDAEIVAREAFGREDGSVGEHARGRLHDPTLGLFVAYLDGRPVSSGRVEMPAGRTFAGIWGGGTIPIARGKGVYRALVGVRATLARERGFRYLTVDALNDTSRPILERIGFVPLTGVEGWVLRPPERPPPARDPPVHSG